MSPKYKLTYFNIRGLGEPIRFILSYMEEDFEDIRIERDQWDGVKHTTPFGKLPLLEEDGKLLTQSVAISRYLGKKAGLAGKDDWENLQIDIIADTITDMRIPLSQFIREPNEDLKKAKKETYITETLPFYLNKLESVAKENGGYLANKKLSWADLMLASMSETLSSACEIPDVIPNYPALHSLRQKVYNLPQIKKWIEKRPVTAI